MPAEPDAVDRSTIDAINADASVLMKQGIALMSDPRPEAASEALRCFDQALDLRNQLPIDDEPLLRYGLAACWLNRADALVRLGGGPQIAEALRSYEEGIALARTLPAEIDPRFPRRLAIAHQNRALVLQLREGPGAADAIAAFTEALAVLESAPAAAIPDRVYMQAAVWVNLANARAFEGAADAWIHARDAARQAIALVTDLEQTDAGAAEVGLKARHVLCHAYAARLAAGEADNSTTAEDVHAASDAADEALELARLWEQQGVDRFRGIAYDLFRFGARVYAIYQPQFLEEFVQDNLDPAQSSVSYAGSPEMQSAAREALALAGRSETEGSEG